VERKIVAAAQHNEAKAVGGRRGFQHSALTLADVAREAGVSEITVSRVIRAKGAIADETRKRVLAAISKVGYVPNRIAGSLASAGSDLIGVIIPSLGNIVYPDVLSGLHDAISERGFRAVVSVTDYRLESERELVRSLLSWRPAALIVTGCEHEPDTRRMLRSAGLTIVELMDADGEAIDISVGMSHARAGRETAAFLLARGYRRFGYVGHDLTSDLRASKRRQAFLATILQAGASLAGEVVTPGRSSVPSGRQALAVILAAHKDIDAVYFSNDDMAIGGVFHCMAEGIAMPGKLAIAGFNGVAMGQALPQPLTTVLTPRFDIGFRAGLAVIARFDGLEVQRNTDVGFELLPGATA
jgi:LacI family transcriptional regulator, gluconate utilization system Gnt-I transcriptional repressor